MIDARKLLDRELKRWGHDILLQRRDRDGNFTNRFERHTVRFSIETNMALFRGLSNAPEGERVDIGRLYYFRHNADPREGDRIYEQDGRFEDLEMGPQGIFEITDVYPVRGRLGRVAFYTVRAQRFRPA